MVSVINGIFRTVAAASYFYGAPTVADSVVRRTIGSDCLIIEPVVFIEHQSVRGAPEARLPTTAHVLTTAHFPIESLIS
jgi:hypothetical protein